jgi:peroxisomal 3,2-trans-enoyl-CoA isomerase
MFFFHIHILFPNLLIFPRMDDISITIVTGNGRFFSAGADVQATLPGGDRSSDPNAVRRDILRSFISNNVDITRSFYTHPKVIVAALNGPAVGLSAAILGFADFVYVTSYTFLLTPFSSLGLVGEGGASFGLVQRLGIAKANEALVMSKRLTCDELVQCGFINKVIDGKNKNDSDGFLKKVLAEVENRLGEHLNQDSIQLIKQLIRRPHLETLEAQGVHEAMMGMQRCVSGAPQAEFKKVASGQKKHKL